MELSTEERMRLINRLDRSFQAMPRWVRTATKHAMGAPSHNPVTGELFQSFREVIEVSADETLLILKEDFEDNGDLAPEV